MTRQLATKEQAQAFIDYAWDTEGMRYKAIQYSDGKYTIVSDANYDPQVERALWKNFQQEFFAGF